MSADVQGLVEGLVAAFEAERAAVAVVVEGESRGEALLRRMGTDRDRLLRALTWSDVRLVVDLHPFLSEAAKAGEVDSMSAWKFWAAIERGCRWVDVGGGLRVPGKPVPLREQPLTARSCVHGSVWEVEGCHCLERALGSDRWRELGLRGLERLAARFHGPVRRRRSSGAARRARAQAAAQRRFVARPPAVRRLAVASSALPVEGPVEPVPERPRGPVVRRARPSQAEALARVAAATGLTVYDGRQHSVHSTFTRRQR